MSDSWENITVGMKVEVQNNDCDLPNTVFWIATVLKIAGECKLLDKHFVSIWWSMLILKPFLPWWSLKSKLKKRSR